MTISRYKVVVSDQLAKCDYLSVTRSHQFTTPVTMPLARSEALLGRASQDDFVMEDDYGSGVTVAGPTIPMLKSLNTQG